MDVRGSVWIVPMFSMKSFGSFKLVCLGLESSQDLPDNEDG